MERARSLAELFMTIGTTMPYDDPVSLTPSQLIDVVAFVLQSNDIPSGSRELLPDLESLRAVRFAKRSSAP